MEIVLSRYTNFLFGWRDTMLKVSNDDFTYTDISSPDKIIHHINDLDYGFKTNNDNGTDCFVIPIKSKDNIYLISLDVSKDNNTSNDFLVFCDYYNYHKHAFMLNIESKDFLFTEQYKLNPKEIVLSLKLYSGIAFHKEILLNLRNNLVVIKTISDATNKKINSIKNEIIQNGESKGFCNFEQEISDKYPDMPLDNESYSLQTEHNFDLNNIDRIRDVYLALCRIIFEIRRSLAERSINSNKKFGNKLDLIMRFIFAKGNINQLDVHIKKNNELKQMYLNGLELNKQYRKKLKDYLNNHSINSHFCIKCGNLLLITGLTNATCLFDEDCKINSILYCKSCSINMCNYCNPLLKSINCAKGHLIKPKQVSFDQVQTVNIESYCSLCDKRINANLICYSCDECLLLICPYCYDNKAINSKQPQCSCGRNLNWRRGQNTFCKKCYKQSKCFWYCFFCRLYFCASCNKTKKNICGGGHNMKEVDANMFSKENLNKNKTVLVEKLANPRIKQLIEGTNFPFNSNCNVCQTKFCFKFYVCYRCSFVKCLECCSL